MNNHRNENIESILYVLKPLIVIENWFGMFRYRMEKGQLTVLNRRMKIYGIFMTIILIVPYFATFIDFLLKNKFTEIDEVIDLVDELVIFIMVVHHIISLALFLVYSKNNVRIIIGLARIDAVLNKTNADESCKKLRKRFQIQLFIFLTSYIIINLLNNIKQDDPPTTKILTAIIDFERHFEVFAFCVFIEILIDKLGVVNINLKRYVRPNNRNMYVNVIIRPENNDIRKYLTNREGNSKLLFLAKAYTIISETNKLINIVFQFHIFKCLLSTFIYVIIIIWTSLYYIRSNAFDNMPRVFMLCFFEILSISAMSFVCELMLLKRRRTKILINDIIMNYDLPVELRIEAKVLMELIEVRPLQIFAYDMFSIDIKLVLKFVSVSTTYLIVIVQLSHLY